MGGGWAAGAVGGDCVPLLAGYSTVLAGADREILLAGPIAYTIVEIQNESTAARSTISP
jgi:hypothetical protein